VAPDRFILLGLNREQKRENFLLFPLHRSEQKTRRDKRPNEPFRDGPIVHDKIEPCGGNQKGRKSQDIHQVRQVISYPVE
jgi:hypothetical protein